MHEKRDNALEVFKGTLKSKMGACFIGSHTIFRGYNLHTELKDKDWLELYVFGITGRWFSSEQLQLMRALWTYTSYPDVRIWNNRVSALAGSVRSTGSLGISAALAVSEASMYGRGIDKQAINFIYLLKSCLDSGGILEEVINSHLDEHKKIPGYGRPFTNKDERIEHIFTLTKQLKFDQGTYLCLALEIENYFLKSGKLQRMDSAGLSAALMADIGLSPQEHYLFMMPAYLAGMPPCYVEAADKTEGVLFPVQCADIAYSGHQRRPWDCSK